MMRRLLLEGVENSGIFREIIIQLSERTVGSGGKFKMRGKF